MFPAPFHPPTDHPSFKLILASLMVSNQLLRVRSSLGNRSDVNVVSGCGVTHQVQHCLHMKLQINVTVSVQHAIRGWCCQLTEETLPMRNAVYELYPPSSGAGVGISVWICVFGALQVFISLLKNFNSLRGISAVAAVMSLGYSTFAFGLTMKNGKCVTPMFTLYPPCSAIMSCRPLLLLGRKPSGNARFHDAHLTLNPSCTDCCRHFATVCQDGIILAGIFLLTSVE